MEQMIGSMEGPREIPERSAVWKLREAIDRYLIERGVGHYCKVTVHQDGRWFDLEGTVDSQWSRAVLFSMVPSREGRRHIVDRLQVVEEPLERSRWS
jgi:hypothetical protein